MKYLVSLERYYILKLCDLSEHEKTQTGNVGRDLDELLNFLDISASLATIRQDLML